jgi:tripartite-type tricarboxylate transporter receptor subunit TctC
MPTICAPTWMAGINLDKPGHDERRTTLYNPPMTARLLSVALALALSLAGTAHAAGWPERPIRFVLGTGAGNTTDILCRLLADRVSRGLGQQVVVENRVSAGAIIAAQTVASAAPDGYTYLFASQTSVVTNIYTYKTLAYDPVRDFTGVGFVGITYFLLNAYPGLPAKNLAELVALDKAAPGTLNFVSDGPQNFSGMLGEWINKRAGTHIVQVPYAVQSKGVQDTIAGRTQLVINAAGASLPYLQSGQLRAIAISAPNRVKPSFADVPTLAETIPGMELGGWYAVFAPKGAPADIVLKMNRALNQALREPLIAERFAQLGIVPVAGTETVEGLNGYWHQEIERWRIVASDLGIHPQ